MTRVDHRLIRQLRHVSEAALQPGGDLVAATVLEPDAALGERLTLWWIDLAGGAPRRAAIDADDVAGPAWSPDGALLAVRLRRGADWTVAVLEAGADDIACAWALPGAVGGTPVWQGPGRITVVVAQPSTPDVGAPYVVREDVWARDGLGPVRLAGTDLWDLDLRQPGNAATRLTQGPGRKTMPAWSPDGTRLAYHHVDLGGMASASIRVLTPAAGMSTTAVGPEWRPSSAVWRTATSLAFCGVAPGSLRGTQDHLLVTELGDGGEGAPVDRTPGFPGAIGGFLDGDLPVATYWDPSPILVAGDGASATVRAHVGGSTHAVRVALDGPVDWTTLLDGACAWHPCAVEPGGRVLALRSSFTEPPEVYVVTDDTPRPASTFNAEVLADAAPGGLRQLLAPGDAETGIEAWFAAPATDGAGPWPAVLLLHGGPHAGSGHLFHADAQLLLGAGIGVVLVNHRGSMGYGDAFGTALTGCWRDAVEADALAAVDAAVARGWADPGRLGVHGQSAGGTLTCWLTARTERFTAAVTENPATNFVSLLGTSDIAADLLPDLLGPCRDGLEPWFMASPISEAHRCRTPTLVISAENDRRCPPEQAEQWYRALRLAGCPAEMLRLPGGTHDASVLGDLRLRRAQEDALVAWFTTHLLAPPAAASVPSPPRPALT